MLPPFPVPVCVEGDSATFGRTDGVRPDGVRVLANGDCRFAFWAGGFDGVTTTEAGASASALLSLVTASSLLSLVTGARHSASRVLCCLPCGGHLRLTAGVFTGSCRDRSGTALTRCRCRRRQQRGRGDDGNRRDAWRARLQRRRRRRPAQRRHQHLPAGHAGRGRHHRARREQRRRHRVGERRPARLQRARAEPRLLVAGHRAVLAVCSARSRVCSQLARATDECCRQRWRRARVWAPGAHVRLPPCRDVCACVLFLSASLAIDVPRTFFLSCAEGLQPSCLVCGPTESMAGEGIGRSLPVWWASLLAAARWLQLISMVVAGCN